MARRLGAEERWITAVRSECPEETPREAASETGLEPGWVAALRYAEQVTGGTGAVEEEGYAALKRHWNDGEILEITMVIGLFNYFNRFNTALDVEITR